MNTPNDLRRLFAVVLGLSTLALAGCGTVGGVVSDLGFATAGGAAGYELSDGKVGGAAAGAVTGYMVSWLAQSEVRRAMGEAERRGYERAMNQAVKQQYWIIQNQQRSRDHGDEREAAYVPVVIPASTIDGVTYNERTEYVRVK